MNDGSDTDTIADQQGADTTHSGDTLQGSGVSAAPGKVSTAPDTVAAGDQHQAVPRTITPAPALASTVTGDVEPAPSSAGTEATHGETIPMGSAPTLLTGVERTPASTGGAQEPVCLPGKEGLIGTTVAGRYHVESLLGAGGMGTVYLAEQTAMDRRVVLKFLHPEYSSRSDLKERFHREARAASKLNHPNIIVLHDFGQTDDGRLYMAMEYLEGRTLGDLIESAGALSPLRAIGITLQILTALTEAHANGVVHRDLKPDNILLVKRGEVTDFVKVLDFGIAKIRDQSQGVLPSEDGAQPEDDEGGGEQASGSWEELARELGGAGLDAEAGEGEPATSQEDQTRLTKYGEICGSPGYMAPEQIRGEGAIDHRADLYAVGVILYQLLTGHNPFKGRSVPDMLLRTMDKKVEPLRQSRPDLSLPRVLDDLILQCLSKEASRRPASADEVAEQLREITPTLARQQQERELAMLELVGIRPRWRRHMRWVLPALALGLAALFWFSSGRTLREGTALARGERVLVGVSAPKVPTWVMASAANGQRRTVRGARDRRAARVMGLARILAVAADIPSRFGPGEVDPSALEAELRQVAQHARSMDTLGLPPVQTYWSKIAEGQGQRRVSYVYDVHVFMAALSAAEGLKLRRHFAALRYDRYSFLLTEAVRKRQCQRARELSRKEQETIEHLPKARHKSALNYLQYRLKKCTGSKQ